MERQLYHPSQLMLAAVDEIEVISIKAYNAADALEHRGLRHLHRNTRFTRFCGHLQLNQDKLWSLLTLQEEVADEAHAEALVFSSCQDP
jgi:hypothetical protein